MIRIVTAALLLLAPLSANATTRYADNTLISNCTSGNYSIAFRNCTGSDGNAYNTFAAVVSPTAAGDTILIRAGTWNDRINLQDAGKTGAAGNYITIAGYPGERPVIQFTDTGSYGAIKARGNRGYFIFENFIIDGINQVPNSGWSIRDGNHDFIIRNIEIKNAHQTAFYVAATNVLIEDVYIHDFRSTCEVGDRSYGIYAHHGSNLIARGLHIENMPGGGIQVYPGPWDGLQILNNDIHDNGWCSSTTVGGIVVSVDSTGGGDSGVVIANNLIYRNGYKDGVPGTGGSGGGIRMTATGGFTISGLKIYNNTIYDNQARVGGTAYGINVGSAGLVNTELINNIVLGNETGQIINAGTNTTQTTNKTTGSITDCTPSTSDFRLRSGSNPCRNAGTAVSTRTPVGVTDIGAYEQPEISTVSIDSATIEATFNTGGRRLSPTSGFAGLTPACSGHASCGTPSILSNNLKTGSDVTIQIVLSGIGGDGNCALSQAWTLTGSSANFGAGYVGPPGSAVQAVNDFSNFNVTEICTGSGGSPPTGMIAHYKLNEGAGTTATDETGNGNDGTVSAGVTWPTVYQGTGLRIPTDATFNHLNVPDLGPINPSTTDFGTCAIVKPDTQYTSKVVASFGGNGTGQRLYVGFILVNGQLQWGIGVQGSGFSTGSEFPVRDQLTFLCLVGDAAADTVTLWVDGVKGTGSGTSVKSVTSSYTTVGTLRYGNDGTNSTNNGGFDLDEVYVWNTKPTDQDIVDLKASLFPTGGSNACYGQGSFQIENSHLLNGEPIGIAPNLDGSIDVVANGHVAFKTDLKCLGSAGSGIALRLYYSINGGEFALQVPQTLGAAGVYVWGETSDTKINRGVSSGCVDDTGLTPNDGVSVLDAVASPTITLDEDHCTSLRAIVRVGNIPGTTIRFRWQQDNGEVLTGEYPETLPTINVVGPKSSVR